jgi:hypothetical protein
MSLAMVIYFLKVVKFIFPFINFQDINECTTNNGGCSNNCTNTIGSYFCSCPLGFQLQSDQRTCKSKLSFPCQYLKKEFYFKCYFF